MCDKCLVKILESGYNVDEPRNNDDDYMTYINEEVDALNSNNN